MSSHQQSPGFPAVAPAAALLSEARKQSSGGGSSSGKPCRIRLLLFGLLGIGTNYLVPVALFLQVPLMQNVLPEGIRLASSMNVAVNTPIIISVFYVAYRSRPKAFRKPKPSNVLQGTASLRRDALIVALLLGNVLAALIASAGWHAVTDGGVSLALFLACAIAGTVGSMSAVVLMPWISRHSASLIPAVNTGGAASMLLLALIDAAEGPGEAHPRFGASSFFGICAAISVVPLLAYAAIYCRSKHSSAPSSRGATRGVSTCGKAVAAEVSLASLRPDGTTPGESTTSTRAAAPGVAVIWSANEATTPAAATRDAASGSGQLIGESSTASSCMHGRGGGGSGGGAGGAGGGGGGGGGGGDGGGVNEEDEYEAAAAAFAELDDAAAAAAAAGSAGAFPPTTASPPPSPPPAQSTSPSASLRSFGGEVLGDAEIDVIVMEDCTAATPSSAAPSSSSSSVAAPSAIGGRSASFAASSSVPRSPAKSVPHRSLPHYCALNFVVNLVCWGLQPSLIPLAVRHATVAGASEGPTLQVCTMASALCVTLGHAFAGRCVTYRLNLLTVAYLCLTGCFLLASLDIGAWQSTGGAVGVGVLVSASRFLDGYFTSLLSMEICAAHEGPLHLSAFGSDGERSKRKEHMLRIAGLAGSGGTLLGTLVSFKMLEALVEAGVDVELMT